MKDLLNFGLKKLWEFSLPDWIDKVQVKCLLRKWGIPVFPKTFCATCAEGNFVAEGWPNLPETDTSTSLLMKKWASRPVGVSKWEKNKTIMVKYRLSTTFTIMEYIDLFLVGKSYSNLTCFQLNY